MTVKSDQSLQNTKNILPKKTTTIVKSQYVCEFCKKDFVRENSLIAHSCEKKRRWMFRDEKYVKMGFFAYQKFYAMTYAGVKNKHKTYNEFMASPYYTAFTKYGRYLLEINAIESDGFTEYLIKNSIAVDNWTFAEPYERWVRELGRKESPDRAVERNILLMQQWSKDSGESWNDFFRKVNPQLATKWIRTGRISPWLLFAGFGEVLFERMSDEQMNIVKDILDPNFWILKIQDNLEDVKLIKSILSEAGV